MVQFNELDQLAAGIPTVLFAFGHSFSAGIVTAVVFLLYTQLDNHVLSPLVMRLRGDLRLADSRGRKQFHHEMCGICSA
jgi:hypothetical protein